MRDLAHIRVKPYNNFEIELTAPPIFSNSAHATIRQDHRETMFRLTGPPSKSKYLALSFGPHSLADQKAVCFCCLFSRIIASEIMTGLARFCYDVPLSTHFPHLSHRERSQTIRPMGFHPSHSCNQKIGGAADGKNHPPQALWICQP